MDKTKGFGPRAVNGEEVTGEVRVALTRFVSTALSPPNSLSLVTSMSPPSPGAGTHRVLGPFSGQNDLPTSAIEENSFSLEYFTYQDTISGERHTPGLVLETPSI